MRRFLPFLLCLSLSFFTAALAVKPALTCAQDGKGNEKAPAGEQGHPNILVDNETGEDLGSDDDDSMEGASNEDGEDANEDDNGDVVDSQETGVDDGAADNEGDSGTDEGSEETPR